MLQNARNRVEKNLDPQHMQAEREKQSNRSPPPLAYRFPPSSPSFSPARGAGDFPLLLSPRDAVPPSTPPSFLLLRSAVTNETSTAPLFSARSLYIDRPSSRPKTPSHGSFSPETRRGCSCYRSAANLRSCKIRMDQASTGGASDKPAVGSNDSWRGSASGDEPAAAGGGCFDCNVCLEFAVEPVVTLCGHLYCWPCIYEWLRRRGYADDRSVSTRQPCPVCKAALTLDSFVPLYGRGGVRSKKPRPCGSAIPRRPAVHREAVEQGSAQHVDTESDPPTSPPRDAPLDLLYPPPPLGRGMNVMHSASGGTALAALTWFFRGQVPPPYYSSPYHLAAWENRSPRLRRQHMEVERCSVWCT